MKKNIEIIRIIISSYEEELRLKKELTIESFLYNYKSLIYSKIDFDAKQYSKLMGHSNYVKDLIIIDNINKIAKITNYDISSAIEDYKILQISKLNLKKVEELISKQIINLFKRETTDYKTNSNPQTIFNNYNKDYISNQLSKDLFSNMIYSKTDILNYYFNNREGYKKIIKNITIDIIKDHIKEIDLLKIIETKDNFEIKINNKVIHMIFKDAQYLFFEDKKYIYESDLTKLIN